ncbi:MAG: DEAD/DEAH box helicase family protein, partial [Phaeodactylibacter sp.]|nr:DEAD/DEAH box helicase family protein [Phaeodactylibacter sp.]
MARNEKQTRKQIIDRRLAEAGWDVANAAQVVEEFDIEVGLPDGVAEPRTKYDGRQFSDYVLMGKDGKPLAVVEAKKTSVDARVGEEQAKQYAYNIQKQYGGELPFCFYTNGLDIYFWDLGNYPPRKVYGFPTRLDLERLQVLRRRRNPLSQELINVDIAGRPYQIEAIRTVMESMERQRRRFLLVMATGTGKTRTTIALVDALMRAGWIEKTLFLVDRIALRNQALDAFKEHLPSEPRWPKEKEKAFYKDRRIYVTTYPTMANLLERQYFSPHFFDLVVTDESHRSIYNVYKDVLEYFDGVKLGLTATPTDVIDHNTFKLFECQDGIPSFAYTYDEAVNNIPPYLTDFEVLKIQTKFQQEGINQRTISLEDQ